MPACGQNVLLTGSRNTEHQLRQRTGLPGIIPSVVSWPTPPHTIVLILSHCLKTSVICITSVYLPFWQALEVEAVHSALKSQRPVTEGL